MAFPARLLDCRGASARQMAHDDLDTLLDELEKRVRTASVHSCASSVPSPNCAWAVVWTCAAQW
jgi:hypothetical protein